MGFSNKADRAALCRYLVKMIMGPRCRQVNVTGHRGMHYAPTRDLEPRRLVPDPDINVDIDVRIENEQPAPSSAPPMCFPTEFPC